MSERKPFDWYFDDDSCTYQFVHGNGSHEEVEHSGDALKFGNETSAELRRREEEIKSATENTAVVVGRLEKERDKAIEDARFTRKDWDRTVELKAMMLSKVQVAKAERRAEAAEKEADAANKLHRIKQAMLNSAEREVGTLKKRVGELEKVLRWVDSQLIASLCPDEGGQNDISVWPIDRIERWAVGTRKTREDIRLWQRTVLWELVGSPHARRALEGGDRAPINLACSTPQPKPK